MGLTIECSQFAESVFEYLSAQYILVHELTTTVLGPGEAKKVSKVAESKVISGLVRDEIDVTTPASGGRGRIKS